ncbi:MAG: hypothetical protein M0021_09820 [Clostridia bacterium]|nr:hypothetical protein [Clostridia bacterium]
MRTKAITINGKSFEITEKRISELEELFKNVKVEKFLSLNNFNELITTIYTDVKQILGISITDEDLRNAYPSEIEEAVEAFIDVNFFGLKRVAGPLINLALAGLARKS